MKNFTNFLICITLLLSVTALWGQSNRNPALKISHLTGDFYVYTTYNMYNNTRVPSNSMYVVTKEGVVMIDTPWDTTQFQPLLDSIQKRHGQKVVLCVSTHYHEDRTGGLAFLNAKGIKTYSSKQTYELCKQYNFNRAGGYFEKDTVFTVGSLFLQTCYGGQGHTKDNIVIWFPQEKVLYGGCLIKSTDAKDLGNTRDANLTKWPSTLRTIKKKFNDPKYIIPGHESWSSNRSIDHTLKLLQVEASSKKRLNE